jgi:hypothetical protein
VIIMVLLERDKMQSILLVYCIQMIVLMLVRNLDLNNNISSALPPSTILSLDIKELITIDSDLSQTRIRFN